MLALFIQQYIVNILPAHYIYFYNLYFNDNKIQLILFNNLLLLFPHLPLSQSLDTLIFIFVQWDL